MHERPFEDRIRIAGTYRAVRGSRAASSPPCGLALAMLRAKPPK
jgi:hypothetical protein